jgi:hypothetical protein
MLNDAVGVNLLAGAALWVLSVLGSLEDSL